MNAILSFFFYIDIAEDDIILLTLQPLNIKRKFTLLYYYKKLL